MKSFFLTVTTFFLTFYSLRAQESDLFFLYGTKLVNDSPDVVFPLEPNTVKNTFRQFHFTSLLQQKMRGKAVLFTTKKERPVEALFFPGISDKKALVIGGMHGSELSAIAVAEKLVASLSSGEMPYYNVIIIPSLFPDNAQAARDDKEGRVQHNSGRYSSETAADPNRQMPLPGRPFEPDDPFDAVGREMEGETKTLLQLIQHYQPHRIISIHAIKDRSKAGIFADPRTDYSGLALGFESDKALALLMARYIEECGGACPGNYLKEEPTALYYLDPPVAEEGQKQERSYQFASLTGKSKGVSFGTWCSTAVCSNNPEYNRSAIRTLTVEFPGYLLPAEYKTAEERQRYAKMVEVYAASIQQYFLQPFFVEESTGSFRFASR